MAAFNIRNGSQPQIHNTRVSYAENIGLSVQGGSKPLLDNLTIEYSGHFNGSGREAIEQDLASDPAYQEVHLIENYADRITLRGGTVTGTRTFDFDNIPVYVDGNLQFAPDSNVTLVPGTILKFWESYNLWSRGILTANGTADAPIILTSIWDDSAGGDSDGQGTAVNAIPGRWEGLYLDSNVSLSHLEVRYAGNANNAGNTFGPYRVAAVHVRGGAQVSLDDVRIIASENEGISVVAGNLQLSNSEIIQSGRTAIDVSGTATIQNTLIQGAALGILVRANATASGTNNAFVGLTNGAQNDRNDFSRANFENNWWGHSGGPHDPSTADGQANNNPSGTPVSDWVRYANWRTTPPDGMKFGPSIKSIRFDKRGSAEDEVLYVEFEQPIQPASFDLGDIQITGPDAVFLEELTQLSSTRFMIDLAGPQNQESNGNLPMVRGNIWSRSVPTSCRSRAKLWTETTMESPVKQATLFKDLSRSMDPGRGSRPVHQHPTPR